MGIHDQGDSLDPEKVLSGGALHGGGAIFATIYCTIAQ